VSSRELPTNIAAESGVLSCILTNKKSLPAVVAMGLSDAHFSDQRHARLYEEIVALYRAGRPVDGVTLDKILTAYGGLGKRLYESPSSDTPDAAEDYARTIVKSAIAREAILAFRKHATRAYNPSNSIESILADMQKSMDEMRSTLSRTTNPCLSNPADALAAGSEWSVRPGVPWFDERIRFASGRVHGVAADPSAGKSMFAIQSAASNLKDGVSVAVFLAEDDRLDVQLTLLAQTGELDMAFVNRIRFDENFKTEENLQKVRELWDEHFSNVKLRAFTVSQGPEEVLDNIRALNDDKYYIIIDHAFAVIGQGEKRIEDHRAFTEFYAGLNRLAKNGNHVIVVLNQFKLSGRKSGLTDRELDAQYGGAGIAAILWTVVHMWVDDPVSKLDSGWIAVNIVCKKNKARLVIDEKGNPVDPMDGPGIIYIQPEHRLFKGREVTWG
jgi:replicative DNA helicase